MGTSEELKLAYLSPEEACQPKLCQHCNLFMDVIQISLTEAIRMCSNCSFSLNDLGNCNIQLIRRSFKDIGKGFKEWNHNICSEEEEMYNLKSWIDKVNLNLNKFDSESDEDFISQRDGKYEEDSPQASEKTLGEDDADILEELDAILANASLQNSPDDDFPFPLRDLFKPLKCNAALEGFGDYDSNYMPHIGTSERTPLYAMSAQLGDNVNFQSVSSHNMSSGLESQFISEDICPDWYSNADLVAQQKESLTVEFCGHSENPSENGLKIPSHNNSEVAISAPHELPTEESISNINSCRISLDQTCAEPDLYSHENLNECPNMSQCGTSDLKKTISEDCDLFTLNDFSKSGLCRKTYFPAKQISRLCLSEKIVSLLPVVGDPFQLPENTESRDCVVDVSLPDLVVHSCMPKIDDEILWNSRKQEKLQRLNNAKVPGSMKHSNKCTRDENHLSNSSSPKTQVTLIQSDVNKTITNSPPTSPSCLSIVSSQECNSLTTSDRNYGFENSKRDAESVEHKLFWPFETDIQTRHDETVSLAEDFRSEIVITVPATEDIPEELFSNELGEIIFGENTLEFAAFGFPCSESNGVAQVKDENLETALAKDHKIDNNFREIEVTSSHSELNSGNDIHPGIISNVLDENPRMNNNNNMAEMKNLQIGNVINMFSGDFAHQTNELPFTPHKNSLHQSDIFDNSFNKCISPDNLSDYPDKTNLTSQGVLGRMVCEDECEELVAFSGTKFKPKSGKRAQSVRKYSEILGDGKYVNLLHIIKKEIEESANAEIFVKEEDYNGVQLYEKC